MNTKKIRMLLLLGYAVPTVYLAMYCDYNFQSLPLVFGLYGVFAVSHGLLCSLGMNTQNSLFVILGNLLGMGCNYLCWLIPHPEKWRFYFKCSPSSKFLLAVLGISFATQLVFLTNDYAKRHWRKP